MGGKSVWEMFDDSCRERRDLLERLSEAEKERDAARAELIAHLERTALAADVYARVDDVRLAALDRLRKERDEAREQVRRMKADLDAAKRTIDRMHWGPGWD